MKTPKLTSFLVMGAILTAAAVTVVSMNPVFAVGLSWAPGQEAVLPGDAQNFAPGQEAEQHCIGCVKELTPGQEALDLGIIGPPKKIQ